VESEFWTLIRESIKSLEKIWTGDKGWINCRARRTITTPNLCKDYSS